MKGFFVLNLWLVVLVLVPPTVVAVSIRRRRLEQGTTNTQNEATATPPSAAQIDENISVSASSSSSSSESPQSTSTTNTNQQASAHTTMKQKHLHKPPTPPASPSSQNEPHNKQQQQQQHPPLPTTLPATTATTKDCGNMLIQQTEGIVVYDDFEAFDPKDGQLEEWGYDILCHEQEETPQQQQSGSSSGNQRSEDSIPTKHFCFAPNKAAAILVHGTCHRGLGTTHISIVNMDKDAHIMFSCQASTQAIPDLDCQCQIGVTSQQEDYGECTGDFAFPFRVESHIGYFVLPEKVAAECTLKCKMPNTDE
jgi:hypothetical protein